MVHKIIVLVGMLFCVNLVHAADYQKENNSRLFTFSGILQDYDSDAGTIEVNANRFKLASDLVVYSGQSKYASVNDLELSSPVGLRFDDVQTTPRTVDAIWILPSLNTAAQH